MLSVKQKMSVARGLNHTLRVIRRISGRGMQLECRRRGVVWSLDLDEGIDISIYALGAYEPRTLNAYEKLIKPGSVVFDIGANIGAHTLHFARLVGPTGRVFAFEPTDFAIAKLRRNLAMNPELAGRVDPQQCFLVADSTTSVPATVHSSWPVAHAHDDLDPEHQGKPQTLTAARTITADGFCQEAGIHRLDFIKIDVDGNEYPVLRGLEQTLRRYRPDILIELAPFVYEGAKAHEFDEFIGFLSRLDYDFSDVHSGQPISRDPVVLRRNIPRGSGRNVLLRARR
jgi:FkbM family methyltransferase